MSPVTTARRPREKILTERWQCEWPGVGVNVMVSSRAYRLVLSSVIGHTPSKTETWILGDKGTLAFITPNSGEPFLQLGKKGGAMGVLVIDPAKRGAWRVEEVRQRRARPRGSDTDGLRDGSEIHGMDRCRDPIDARAARGAVAVTLRQERSLLPEGFGGAAATRRFTVSVTVHPAFRKARSRRGHPRCDTRVGSGATRTKVLPKFSPRSISAKAVGMISSPSRIYSR